MPTIYDLKPRFQALLRPVLRALRGMGVTPNMLTVLALGLSFSSGCAMWLAAYDRRIWLVVPLAMFVRMALNALDGMMAREYHLTSSMGLVLNEVGDVVSDIAVYLPLVAHAQPGWPVFAFVLLAVVNEFTGLLGVSVCGARVNDGPMGKSDRAFAIGLLALILYKWPGAASLVAPYCGLLALLLVKSTFNRMRSALDKARRAS